MKITKAILIALAGVFVAVFPPPANARELVCEASCNMSVIHSSYDGMDWWLATVTYPHPVWKVFTVRAQWSLDYPGDPVTPFPSHESQAACRQAAQNTCIGYTPNWTCDVIRITKGDAVAAPFSVSCH